MSTALETHRQVFDEIVFEIMKPQRREADTPPLSVDSAQAIDGNPSSTNREAAVL